MTAARRLHGDLGIGGPEPDTASFDVRATMTADRPDDDLDIEVPEPDDKAFCDA